MKKKGKKRKRALRLLFFAPAPGFRMRETARLEGAEEKRRG